MDTVVHVVQTALCLYEFALQLLLKAFVVFGLKDLPKDLFAFIGRSEQQLFEVALRDHRDLHELSAVKSDDPVDHVVDLRPSNDHLVIGHF